MEEEKKEEKQKEEEDCGSVVSGPSLSRVNVGRTCGPAVEMRRRVQDV